PSRSLAVFLLSLHDALPISHAAGGRGGDPAQALGTEQCHVDGRGGDQQALVGADVGGGLGAADVLLARLQGEGEAAAAVEVGGADRKSTRLNSSHVKISYAV